jgi:hypothetical protein
MSWKTILTDLIPVWFMLLGLVLFWLFWAYVADDLWWPITLLHAQDDPTALVPASMLRGMTLLAATLTAVLSLSLGVEVWKSVVE